MTDAFTMKPGDRKFAIKYQLSDYAAGSDLLDGATVRFQMMSAAGVTVIDAAGVVLDVDGIVAYEFADGDTDDLLGIYRAEFKITWGDGLVQHYPSRGFIPVAISSDVPDL